MSRKLVLVIRMAGGYNEQGDRDRRYLTDALNEALNHPEVYDLIDDSFDEGWEYIG